MACASSICVCYIQVITTLYTSCNRYAKQQKLPETWQKGTSLPFVRYTETGKKCTVDGKRLTEIVTVWHGARTMPNYKGWIMSYIDTLSDGTVRFKAYPHQTGALTPAIWLTYPVSLYRLPGPYWLPKGTTINGYTVAEDPGLKLSYVSGPVWTLPDVKDLLNGYDITDALQAIYTTYVILGYTAVSVDVPDHVQDWYDAGQYVQDKGTYTLPGLTGWLDRWVTVANHNNNLYPDIRVYQDWLWLYYGDYCPEHVSNADTGDVIAVYYTDPGYTHLVSHYSIDLYYGGTTQQRINVTSCDDPPDVYVDNHKPANYADVSFPFSGSTLRHQTISGQDISFKIASPDSVLWRTPFYFFPDPPVGVPTNTPRHKSLVTLLNQQPSIRSLHLHVATLTPFVVDDEAFFIDNQPFEVR